MKNIFRISATILAALMLFSCNNADTPASTSTGNVTTAATTEATDSTQPISTTLTISYDSKSGGTKEATGEGAVELAVSRA
mgnify:CR=1 FL=1